MIRVAGICCLLLASWALGSSAARSTYLRVKHNHLLIAALEEMERELQHRSPPLPQLLSILAHSAAEPLAAFFRRCAEGITRLDGETFAQLWSDSIQQTPLSLPPEELLIWAELGQILGRYDRIQQCEAIRQARDRLLNCLTEAEEQYKKCSKLYHVLGLTAGCFLVILLL